MLLVCSHRLTSIISSEQLCWYQASSIWWIWIWELEGELDIGGCRLQCSQDIDDCWLWKLLWEDETKILKVKKGCKDKNNYREQAFTTQAFKLLILVLFEDFPSEAFQLLDEASSFGFQKCILGSLHPYFLEMNLAYGPLYWLGTCSHAGVRDNRSIESCKFPLDWFPLDFDYNFV